MSRWTISIAIYDRVQALDYPGAAATALPLLLLSFVVLAATYAGEAKLHRLYRRHETNIQATEIVLGEVNLDLGQQLTIMGPPLIQPEHGGVASRPGPRHGEGHPVADGRILGLAGAENIPLFHCLLEEDLTVLVDDANDPIARG